MSTDGNGRLEGRVAIITGSARGLGSSIARLFAAQGASVLVTDILDEEGEKTAAEIREAGGKATFQSLDVTQPEQWAKAIARCEAEFGTADVFVSNAFRWSPGTAADVALEDWQAGIDVNLTGPYLGMKSVLPGMRELGRGSIVAIGSSMGGEVAAPDFAGYQAAKAGTTALIKHVAVTYAREGIRANSVHAGPMYTPIQDETGFKEVMEQIVENFPINRVADPDEVAWSALFLASDESSYITGTAVIPDGGSSVGL